MPAKKTATAVKSSSRSRASKGEHYVCDVCGLSLVVDEECGCVEAHEILCCGEPMKAKKATVKAK